MNLLADPLLLSRVQFAANISFHILFPAITLALAWVLLYFKLRYNRSGDAAWMDAYRLWVKVFALSFAIGVVSGVTMSFQFGTNWPGYMNTVGNIAGPLLAYEVLTAFFLEATFLGIMLFGSERVSPRVHTVATLLVAVGTTLSAFWILALNSWMQTPAGFTMIDGQAHATDWLAVLFNPSFPYRFAHMMIASGLVCAFLIAGVSAWRWRRGDEGDDVRVALGSAVGLAALLIPLQIVVGDLHGINTFHHQPAKLAAMEGIWETQRGAAAVLFAIPDQAAQANRYEVAIPGLASLYLGHSLDTEVRGLKEFPDAQPPVAVVFWAFRLMVGVGILMLIVSWTAFLQLRRQGRPGPLVGRALVAMTFSGWVALLAGWFVTETGRQPWLVQGVLSTADAVGPAPAQTVALSLAMYLALYVLLLIAFVSVLFHLARQASRNPHVSQLNPEIDPFLAEARHEDGHA